MNCRHLFAITLLVWLTGCASKEPSFSCASFEACSSVIVSKPLANSTITSGIVYSLPRQNAKLTLKNELITKETLKKQKADEEKKLSEIKSSLKNHQDSAKELTSLIAALGEGNAELKKEYLKKQKDAELRAKLLAQPISEIQGKLDNINLQLLTISLSDSHYSLSATLSALPAYADSSAQFAALINTTAHSSETVELKTTSSGLLTGGSANARGNIDEVFIALAKAYGAKVAVKSSGQSELMSRKDVFRTGSGEPECKRKEFSIEFHIDLQSELPLGQINKYLESNNLCLTIEDNSKTLDGFKASCPKLTEAKTGEKTECQETPLLPKFLDGLVYPRTSTVQLILNDFGSDDGKKSPVPIKSSILSVDIINPNQLAVLTMKEGYFADHKYEYDFTNGMLTRFKSDRQNEWVSFFSMFPEAAKAIVSIPAEIIQLKFNLSSSEKAHYEAQTAILKYQLERQYYQENPDAYINSLSNKTEE